MKEGDKVIITGGEGGLACHLVKVFEKNNDIAAPGRNILDVENEDAVNRYFQQLDKVDLLICNAGKKQDQLLVKMEESTWDDVISANLTSAFLCAKAAAKKMSKQRSGHIIFISSFSALFPHIGQANYAAAKSALLGLAKSMAKEFGARGIRVNVVIPGWLDTPMTQHVSAEQKQEVMEQHTLKAFNTSEAVSSFIYNLHTEMAFTSGQVFNLDSRVL